MSVTRSCAYCGQPAKLQIPSTPSDVCLTHAIEFWTGLLTYVKDRSAEFQTEEMPWPGPLPHPSGARSLAKGGNENFGIYERKEIRLAS